MAMCENRGTLSSAARRCRALPMMSTQRSCGKTMRYFRATSGSLKDLLRLNGDRFAAFLSPSMSSSLWILMEASEATKTCKMQEKNLTHRCQTESNTMYRDTVLPSPTTTFPPPPKWPWFLFFFNKLALTRHRVFGQLASQQ